MERLDKLLSGTGRWSRKEVKELVRTGRVVVNGTKPTHAEEKFSAEDEFLVDGERIVCGAFVYLMLHKPAGYVSSTDDPREKTVLELLPEHLRRIGLFPAGRLDKDTEGLLLLTNDGQLAHELLSPRHHVDKIYFVRVEGELDQSDIEIFRTGVTLADGYVCMSAGLELLERPGEGLVTLREGKYHQIKRMLASRGKPVVYLKRLTMGSLVLDETLEKGQWRELTVEEKKALGR